MSNILNLPEHVLDDHLDGLFDPTRGVVYVFDKQKYQDAVAKLLQGFYVRFGDRFGLAFLSGDEQKARHNLPPKEYAFDVYPILPPLAPKLKSSHAELRVDEPRVSKKRGTSLSF